MRSMAVCATAGLCLLFADALAAAEGKVGAGSEQPSTATAPALVFSEGFEEGRQRWRSTDIGAIDAQQPHGGKACLRICDDSEKKYFSIATRFPVKPNSQYEVTFAARSKDSHHGGLTVIVYDGARDVKTRIVHFYFPFAKAPILRAWRTTKRTFVTGPTSAQCEIRINPANGNRSYRGTVWFDDIAVQYLGPAPKPKPKEKSRLRPLPETPPAEKSLPLRPLAPLVLDLASTECTISCPRNPMLRQAAEALATAVEERAGHRPRIVPDNADATTLGRGPVLVMGNLTESVLGRKLYLTGYDFTDYAWPGKGGHVVRTIRDPFGTGAHVLMIGGSYPADIVAATRAATAMVRRSGPRIGYANTVELGENADRIREWTAKYKSADPSLWDHIGPLGSWTYLEQIGKAAMGYLRTGDEDYLEHFRRELLYYFGHNVSEWRKYHEGRMPSSHSVVDAVLVPWDLLADHPFFSPEERRSIDEKFLLLGCSSEGPRQFRSARWTLYSNHPLGRALDAYWLGRYFHRRYGVEEATRWTIMADNVFASLLVSSKPYEDNEYHQFGASLLAGLMYACAAGKDDYFKSRALREAAERCIMVYPVGAHATYLAAVAVVTNDPTYLAHMAAGGSKPFITDCARMRNASVLGENLRSFCGFTKPQVRKNLLGVHVAPLEPMWYDIVKQSRGGGGHFRVTTPVEKCFDKATIRDGFEPDDFFLMVDGLCGGGHSFQDANCITRYSDHGYRWFRQQWSNSGPTASTLRQQNGVFCALDGQGPGAIHRVARLLYATQVDQQHAALGTALEGIGEIDWRRHVLRKRNAWTLVVDRAVSRKEGEAFVERNWHFRSMDNVALPDGVDSRHEKNCLHLQSVGVPPDNMDGAKDRKEVLRAQVEAGDLVEMAALLHVNQSPGKRTFLLARNAAGWRIAKGASAVSVTLTKDGLRPVVAPAAVVAKPPKPLPRRPSAAEAALPWRKVKVADCAVTAVATGSDCLAAGAKDGRVAVIGLDGKPRWQAQATSWVLSLHFLGDHLLVGEDNGTVSRFDAAGKRLWSVTIPYEKASYSHWSDKRSRIHEITSADIDGDGESEILLSNGDRRIYAFTVNGKRIWKQVIKYGIYNAMTPTTYLGKFALFGGARGPTLQGPLIVFGADGQEIGRLNAPRLESQRIRDLRLWDVDGDGTREIVVARDINNMQLMVCREARDILWQAEVGGAPYGLAVREHDGERQVLCASICGYLHAFDAATGARRWWCYLGDDARFLWPRADGSVLALCPSGRVFVVGLKGARLAMQTLGSPATALLRPGEHRVAPTAIAVGAEDGWLRYLPHRRQSRP